MQTPLDLERELGLRNGQVMHVEMALGPDVHLAADAGAGPVPGAAACRGCSCAARRTHPGGGVFGASGRSAARRRAGRPGAVAAGARAEEGPWLRRAVRGAAGRRRPALARRRRRRRGGGPAAASRAARCWSSAAAPALEHAAQQAGLELSDELPDEIDLDLGGWLPRGAPEPSLQEVSELWHLLVDDPVGRAAARGRGGRRGLRRPRRGGAGLVRRRTATLARRALADAVRRLRGRLRRRDRRPRRRAPGHRSGAARGSRRARRPAADRLPAHLRGARATR